MDFEWVAITLGNVTWITLAFFLGFMAKFIALPWLAGVESEGIDEIVRVGFNNAAYSNHPPQQRSYW